MVSENLHPLAQEVSNQLGQSAGSFMMFVSFRTKPDSVGTLIEAFHVPLTETIKEEGNYTYRLAQDALQPEQFVVVEHWRDLQALDAHLKQPYLTQLLADLDPILAEPPQVRVMIEKFF